MMHEPSKPFIPAGKSPAIEAWCELFSMPCPKTDTDFKRALMMAVIIGRQIESEYDMAAMPNESKLSHGAKTDDSQNGGGVQ